jgi:hypothetical protein
MSVAAVPLLVEQLVAGTVVLLLVIIALAAVLFRAAAGDVLEGTTGTRVADGEVLGIILDGEPGPLYGPGRHAVDPTAGDSTEDDIEDWETVRFSTGATTFAWSHVDIDGQTDVEIALTVTDPEHVWQRATDLDGPLRNVLKQLLEDVTADGADLTELTPAGINDVAEVEYGIAIDRLSVEKVTREHVEADGLDKLA